MGFGKSERLDQVGGNKNRGKEARPRELDLENVPYYPLPPSPNAWERRDPEPPSAEEEYFELQDRSSLNNPQIRKLELGERPDPAYKQSSPMRNGILFIDPSGKSSATPGARSSLFLRSYSGALMVRRDLDYDVYRIGSSPASPQCLFLSSDCVLHGYDSSLDPLIEIDLRTDHRVLMLLEQETALRQPVRRRIRTVAVSPDGHKYLFTVVDTAWCIDRRGNTIWGLSMPLGEGWERVLSRSSLVGDRREISDALSLMQLELPLTQEDIKRQYRRLAMEWHPDRNPKDPASNRRMQRLNDAIAILTGIDATVLNVSDRATIHYRRTKPDLEIDYGLLRIQLSIGGPGLDWIYSSAFGFGDKYLYLGGYSGKIAQVTQEGIPRTVIDVGNTPRQIVDTGEYLFIRTDARLYIVGPSLNLIEMLDIYRKADFVVTPLGFAMVANKNVQWFTPSGAQIAEIRSKHPIRAVYVSGERLDIETRQHRFSALI